MEQVDQAEINLIQEASRLGVQIPYGITADEESGKQWLIAQQRLDEQTDADAIATALGHPVLRVPTSGSPVPPYPVQSTFPFSSIGGLKPVTDSQPDEFGTGSSTNQRQTRSSPARQRNLEHGVTFPSTNSISESLALGIDNSTNRSDFPAIRSQIVQGQGQLTSMGGLSSLGLRSQDRGDYLKLYGSQSSTKQAAALPSLSSLPMANSPLSQVAALPPPQQGTSEGIVSVQPSAPLLTGAKDLSSITQENQGSVAPLLPPQGTARIPARQASIPANGSRQNLPAPNLSALQPLASGIPLRRQDTVTGKANVTQPSQASSQFVVPAQTLVPSLHLVQTLVPSQPLGQTKPLGQSLGQTHPIGQNLGQTNPIGQNLGQSQPIGQNLGQSQPIGQNLGQIQPLAQNLGHTQPLGRTLGQSQPLGRTLGQSQPLDRTLVTPQALGQSMIQSQPLGQEIGQRLAPLRAVGQSLAPVQPLEQSLAPVQHLGVGKPPDSAQGIGGGRGLSASQGLELGGTLLPSHTSGSAIGKSLIAERGIGIGLPQSSIPTQGLGVALGEYHIQSRPSGIGESSTHPQARGLSNGNQSKDFGNGQNRVSSQDSGAYAQQSSGVNSAGSYPLAHLGSGGLGSAEIRPISLVWTQAKGNLLAAGDRPSSNPIYTGSYGGYQGVKYTNLEPSLMSPRTQRMKGGRSFAGQPMAMKLPADETRVSPGPPIDTTLSVDTLEEISKQETSSNLVDMRTALVASIDKEKLRTTIVKRHTQGSDETYSLNELKRFALILDVGISTKRKPDLARDILDKIEYYEGTGVKN
jgi:hypothetical protein